MKNSSTGIIIQLQSLFASLKLQVIHVALDPNAAVVTTDEFGQWGVENNEWCGILGSESTVPTLTPTINTETYYLYNSASNNCIHSSGILDSPIILAYCDYFIYSQWDIPYTLLSKRFPKKSTLYQQDGFLILKRNNCRYNHTI